MEKVMLERPVLELSREMDFEGKTLVFLNPPLSFTVMHLPFFCHDRAIAAPDATRVLGSGLSSDLTITRADERTLEIEAQGGFITNTLDRLFRDSTDPVTQGQRIELSDMVVEVLTLTQDHRPLKVRFTFLLHPEWGPWIHLQVIATEASFEATPPIINYSICTECQNRVIACPAKAITDETVDQPDQGAQFTCHEFTSTLKGGIQTKRLKAA